MKKFKVRFTHVEGDTREIIVEAFDKERAAVRFGVNWGEGMEITGISELASTGT